MRQITIIILTIIISSCSSIYENRDICPNTLNLYGLKPKSIINISNDIIIIDSNNFDYNTINDSCQIAVLSSYNTNSIIDRSSILIKDQNINADSIFIYASNYYFGEDFYVSDTIKFTPLFLSFDINLIGKADENDMIKYSISSEIIGYTIEGDAIMGSHNVKNSKTIIVLRPNKSILTLEIQVFNPNYAPEIIRYDLNKFIERDKTHYKIDIDNYSGQIISLTY